jgi:hypothetical protein
LVSHFGEEGIFIDVDKIDPGIDFKEAIYEEVGKCDVLIAVIGKQWLTIEDDTGRRRLDNPKDYVRIETEAALQRGVRVIPALVGGADMPTPRALPPGLEELASRNSLELGDGVRWHSDVARLFSALERISDQADGAPTRTRDAEPTRERPEDEGRRRWLSRKRLFGLAAVIAIAVAAGITATLAGRGGGSGGESMAPGMPEGGQKGGPFDAIETELVLAHVPRAIRSTCRSIPPIAPGAFLRSVRCAQGGGSKGGVTYSRAHSADALRAYLLQRVGAAGLKYPTAWSCRQRQPAADEWVREGAQLHVEQPSHRAEGRVLCFKNASTATLQWTDTPTKLLARASRPVSDWHSLYAWWRTNAGPEKELAMGNKIGMTATTKYPDAIEKELLLNHLPPEIRKTCSRGTDFDRNQGFLRAVKCSQGIAGSTVEYMYAHSGTALKRYADLQAGTVGVDFPTSNNCANSSKAVDTWVRSGDIDHHERHFSRRAEGRVLCYVGGGGTAFVEWTDNPTGIYAVATRPSSERKALYRWWARNAGPGALEMIGMPKTMP